MRRIHSLCICPVLILTITWPSAATTAIANWDCVPYQTFDSTFNLGVVAFHETGVDVEFFADGSSLGTVSDPTYNARTDVYEYWVALDAADYADGPVVLTATATPDGGGHTARQLAELTLFANSGGSLTGTAVVWVDCDNGDDDGAGTESDPYQTVERGITEVGDGGRVYLKASRNYLLTSLYGTAGYTHWTTVSAAPGLGPEDVHIAGSNAAGTSSGRYGDDMIRWCNVSFYTDQPEGYHTVFYFTSNQHAWFDSVTIFDTHGRFNGGQPMNGNSPYYVWGTNCLVHDMANGWGGLRGNVNANICSDIYRPGNNTISINFTLYTIDKGTTSAHPDFFQCYCTDGLKENVILYNMKAYNMGAQGVFGCNEACGLRDVAFVNVLLEKDPPESALMSQPGYMEHVLAWHFTTVDHGWTFRDPSNVSGWVVKNGNWSNFNGGEVTTLANSDISHNHFAGLSWNQPEPFGTDATLGDQQFVDTAADDYRVTQDSPCYHSGTPLPGVPADVDGVLYDAATPNRGCFASANSAGITCRTGRAMRTPGFRLSSTDGSVHIAFGTSVPEGTTVQLVDLRGRTVLSHTLGRTADQLTLPGPSAGFYCMRVLSPDAARAEVCVVSDR